MAGYITNPAPKRKTHKKKKKSRTEVSSSSDTDSESEVERKKKRREEKEKERENAARKEEVVHDVEVKDAITTQEKPKKAKKSKTTAPTPAPAPAPAVQPSTSPSAPEPETSEDVEMGDAPPQPSTQPRLQSPEPTAPVAEQPKASKQDDEFSSIYLRKIASELADDLDKVREANDFTIRSLPMLIHALKQGQSIFGEEDKRRVVGAAGVKV